MARAARRDPESTLWNEGKPPLDEATSARLLIPHETVRDPLHGDIVITSLERRLIDTAAFQRLRKISQLGPTSLVYPGAVHNRFLHSLGVLHMAQRMVETVNGNAKLYGRPEFVVVPEYGRLLARLCALLHDLAHLPFGHTLEDEGNLADAEWADASRSEHWLGPKSEVARELARYFTEAGLTSEAASAVMAEVRQYITGVEDAASLPLPYVADIVGNTLCADLLDYVERDAFFCGLRERCGDRALRYIAVMRLQQDKSQKDHYHPVPDRKLPAEARVVLLAYRFEHDHRPTGANQILVLKEDIITEAIDLLRKRQLIAEKVYFHRTKMAASAMLITAVSASSYRAADFRECSDEELIAKLRSGEQPAPTRRLIQAFDARRLYRTVYRLRYRPESERDQVAAHQWNDVYKRFRNPAQRRSAEEFVELFYEFKPGTVSIYCPDREMNVKEFRLLVQTRPEAEIKTLERILDTTRKSEMAAIRDRFAELWQLMVYVDPDQLDVSQVQHQQVQDLNALCESELVFGQPSDIQELTHKGRRPTDQLASRAAEWYESEHPGTKVPYSIVAGVSEGVIARGDAPETSLEAFKRSLAGLMQRENR